MTRPSILLLDEPLSNLEAAMRLAMRQQLRKLPGGARSNDHIRDARSDRSSIAGSPHRRHECGPRAPKFDAADAVYTQPAHIFVGSFLGSPPMNMISGVTVSSADLRTLPDGSNGNIALPSALAHRLPSEDRSIVVGFRPEQICIVQPARAMLVCGTVILVERQGPHTILTLSLVGEAAQVEALSCPRDSCRRWKSEIQVGPDVLSVFDGETGVRINADRKCTLAKVSA